MRLIDRWLAGADSVRQEAARRGDVAIRGGGGIGRRGILLVAAGAAALGALATFLLDPDRGRSRRARYGDQAMGLVRRGARGAARAGRLVGSTAEGKMEAVRVGSGGQPDLNDATLTEKLETELFRDPSIAKGKININVERGVVVLRGEVDDDKTRRKLERQAGRVPGVWSVENLLHLPGEPAQETVARGTS
jgi:hyperosmotically inducible protein